MKTKIHTVYKTKDGQRVPGVTTIIGILDKPALIHWAWQCGIDGEDYRKVRDKAANIGTIAHYLIKCHLKKEEPDLSEFAKADIDKAETSFLAYLEWEKGNNIKPIKIEEPMISELFQYGGTIDLYAVMNDKPQLIDFKTGKGIYPEMRLQVAAYRHLIVENIGGGANGYCGNILHINKETGEFKHHPFQDLSEEWEMFKNLITIYNLKKKIWKK